MHGYFVNISIVNTDFEFDSASFESLDSDSDCVDTTGLVSLLRPQEGCEVLRSECLFVCLSARISKNHTSHPVVIPLVVFHKALFLALYFSSCTLPLSVGYSDIFFLP